MFLAMLRLRVCDVEKNIHFKSAPSRKTLSPPQVILSIDMCSIFEGSSNMTCKDAVGGWMVGIYVLNSFMYRFCRKFCY